MRLATMTEGDEKVIPIKDPMHLQKSGRSRIVNDSKRHMFPTAKHALTGMRLWMARPFRGRIGVRILQEDGGRTPLSHISTEVLEQGHS
jgi:hypothetical protein